MRRVGQEIIQFVEAEQLGASEWRLSKLLRGRRGTDWAMSAHQVGEVVLVLDPAPLTRISSLDGVGLGRFYRAVSIGSDPSLPAAVAFTNEGASLKPYAPVHLQGSRNGAGDLTITWVRRTRYSGEWRDSVDVPLNEASEAYEADVLDGDGQVRLVLDPRHGAALARRSVRLPAPMERVACAHGECATRYAPLHRHGRGHLPDGVACRNRRGSSDVQGHMAANFRVSR
jgi:hypothetical protein